MMRFFAIAVTGAAAALGGATQAGAETLPVSGIYAAGSDEAATVRTIALESFSGDKGTSLGFAISDSLETAVFDGEPWFLVYPTAGEDVDAVMRGSAGIEIRETDLEDRKVTDCKKRDKDKKCIEEKVTFYECTRLEVTLYPQLRLIARDGTEIYSNRTRLEDAKSYCANDSTLPSADAMLEGLIRSFAWTVRRDLAPEFRSEDVRVLESRKGMDRGSRNAFRDAVRLTKTDIDGACSAFAALESANPAHVSILFNIGLCAEGRGELDEAERYYGRALSIEPGKDYAVAGLDRVASKRRAQFQFDLRRAAEDAAGPDGA